MKHKVTLTKEQIEEAIRNTVTMGSAANYLRIDWRSFKREAEHFGLYAPSKRNGTTKKIPLTTIINGGHSHYPTSHLSKRLVEEGYKEYKCEVCGIKDYNNKPISLELNHKDGDRSNHLLDNLELLCPNCHSQTDTYRSKKLKMNDNHEEAL